MRVWGLQAFRLHGLVGFMDRGLVLRVQGLALRVLSFRTPCYSRTAAWPWY